MSRILSVAGTDDVDSAGSRPLAPTNLPHQVLCDRLPLGLCSRLAALGSHRCQRPARVFIRFVSMGFEGHEPSGVIRFLEYLPVEGVAEYFLWTPWVTEDLLLADRDLSPRPSKQFLDPRCRTQGLVGSTRSVSAWFGRPDLAPGLHDGPRRRPARRACPGRPQRLARPMTARACAATTSPIAPYDGRCR